MESNEFIIHVMNKYSLLEWASADFEQRPIEDDTLRHTISLLEEFLGLLITGKGEKIERASDTERFQTHDFLRSSKKFVVRS